MKENYESQYKTFQNKIFEKKKGYSINSGDFKDEKTDSVYSGYSKIVESDSLDKKRKDPMLGIRNSLVFIAVVLGFAILKWTGEFSVSFFMAFFVFLLFNPLVERLSVLRVPNFISNTIVILLMIAFLALASWVLSLSVQNLVQILPTFSKRVEEVNNLISNFLVRHFEGFPTSFSFLSNIDTDWLKMLTSTVKGISTGTIDVVKSVMMVLLYVVFLLLERNTLVPKILAATRSKSSSFTLTIFERVTKQISKYIVLKTLISLVTGVLFYIGCRIVDLPVAMIIGVFAFILNFIPTLGSIIITIITIGFSVVQFMPNWNPIIFITIWTLIVQSLFGSVIDPKLQGDQLNLSPFLILFSLALWGYIWGIIGMFLAVPIMSILQIVFANMEGTMPVAILMSNGKVIKKRKNKKNENDNNEETKKRTFYESVILPTSKDKKNNK
ncbi:MAG: AI-2E family transporter [Sphaerochaetaceae bacterium]|nr:AI-2E family transporter [Sphaerochaetaceae bacterium]